MRYNGARSGFTLVELVIVLAIMGLIAGIAAPRYAAAAARYRLKAAAYRVGVDLAQARIAARASSRTVSVSFDTSGANRYNISDAAGYFTGYTVNLGQDPYKVVIKDANFGNATVVTFDGFGNGLDGDITIVAGTLMGIVHFNNASGLATIQISGR